MYPAFKPGDKEVIALIITRSFFRNPSQNHPNLLRLLAFKSICHFLKPGPRKTKLCYYYSIHYYEQNNNHCIFDMKPQVDS